MVKITGGSNSNTVRVTEDAYLMVCLCDTSSENPVIGGPLEGVDLCSDHPEMGLLVKLESLVQMGHQCLLFIEVDGEVVPLRRE